MTADDICLLHTSLISLLENFCPSFPYFFGDHFAVEVLTWEFSSDSPALNGPLNMLCNSIFHFWSVLDVHNISVFFRVNLYFVKSSELLVIAVFTFPPFYFRKYKQIVKCNSFVVFNVSSVSFLDIFFQHFNAFVWAKEEFAWMICPF